MTFYADLFMSSFNSIFGALSNLTSVSLNKYGFSLPLKRHVSSI